KLAPPLTQKTLAAWFKEDKTLKTQMNVLHNSTRGSVNLKLLDLLQKEYAELHGGAQVLTVGSCGLHTLHNAMKAGFTARQIDKLLRALRFLFHNVPARREDYTNITGQRLDVFLNSKLSTSCPDLLKFCLSALLLSHGQATVERGFSINKEVETCNLHDESLEALRIVCDKVMVCGGVLKVPLTKELLASAASARSQSRLYLDGEQKKKSATQEQRRKAAEKELEDLRNQRQILISVRHSLENDADNVASKSEIRQVTTVHLLICDLDVDGSSGKGKTTRTGTRQIYSRKRLPDQWFSTTRDKKKKK
ncbi:hypothetical protein INR49_001749, partial [Caranx melampygus]